MIKLAVIPAVTKIISTHYMAVHLSHGIQNGHWNICKMRFSNAHFLF